jgi:uncharacterized protein YegP (UPF0339 family)
VEDSRCPTRSDVVITDPSDTLFVEARIMHFKVYKDSSGNWRWRLVAANHRIVADSGESYYNKQDCLHAINLIKQSAAGAPIYE